MINIVDSTRISGITRFWRFFVSLTPFLVVEIRDLCVMNYQRVLIIALVGRVAPIMRASDHVRIAARIKIIYDAVFMMQVKWTFECLSNISKAVNPE